MNFQSQQLTVDYIDLNISKLSRNKLREIVLYLSDLGFNVKEKKSTGDIVYLFDNRLNNYQVLFIEKVYNPKQKIFWDGFIVSFSGQNASWLYSIIRKNQFDWGIFDSEKINLGRFDINYVYQDKDYFSYQTTRIFLRRCQKFIGDLPRKRWTRLDEDPKKNDLILKICKRGNPNYQRIYFEPEGLKFELELRKYKAKQFQHWLFENQITEHFFKRWSQLLPIKESSLYTNWILDFQRKKNAIEFNRGSLVINYLNSKNLSSYKKSDNLDNFYRFLQFLSYLRELKIRKSIILNGQIFYKIQFPLSDFLTYIGIDSTNNYQLKKLISFLDTIQDIRLFEICFNEDSFRGSVGFPSYRIFKQNKLWLTELYMAEELYTYRYPFNFNKFFLTYQNKYDLIVKLQILDAFSQLNQF